MLFFINAPLIYLSTSSANKQIGGIAEYDSEREDWSSYVERIELLLIAYDITGESSKKAMLVSCCEI